MLHLFCEGDPSKWPTNLPRVEHAINTLLSSSSGLSPFCVVFEFQQPLFSIQGRERQVPTPDSPPSCYEVPAHLEKGQKCSPQVQHHVR